MERARLVAPCIVAAFVLSGVATATAPAAFREEPPEYGQCLRKPFHGTGIWRNAACTIPGGPGATEHRYEWYPGFGQNGAGDLARLITRRKFTSKIKKATVAVLHVDHLPTVICAGETAQGEITGPKTVGNVVVRFTGCTETAGNGCQRIGQPPGTIVTDPLQGELGIIKEFAFDPLKNKAGLVLYFEGTEFECAGIPVVVTGAVIRPTAANSMRIRETEQFSSAAGEQVPKSFAFVGKREQQPAFVANIIPEYKLVTSIAGGGFADSSLSLTTIEKFEMNIEVSTLN